MATQTNYSDKIPGPGPGHGKVVYIGVTVDCSETPISSGDTMQVINIPADTFVREVIVREKTAEGDAATIDVGDGDNPDGWLDGIDINATAGTIYNSAKNAGTDEAYGKKGGKWYGSADTIDITANNDLDTAVLDIIAVCIVKDWQERDVV